MSNLNADFDADHQAEKKRKSVSSTDNGNSTKIQRQYTVNTDLINSIFF